MRRLIASTRAACAIVALLGAAIGCERATTLESTAPATGGSHTPNIVFVMVDTLRADRLGTYGHGGGLAPTMDAIASEGVTFERAIAQSPWTQPSIASLFCSYHPGVHQVTSYATAFDGALEGGPKLRVFSDSFTTLAEALQSHGYETAAFVANPFIQNEFGIAQGFGYFDASFARNTTPGSVVNSAAAAWLRERASDKPFFLYLHYMDVHGPYNAGPEFLDPLLDAVEKLPNKQLLTPQEVKKLSYLRKLPPRCNNRKRHTRLARFREYWEARYDAGVREQDHHLAALRKSLQEMGLWRDACVILTSDHGEALCEHGTWDHGYTVYNVELHVPLILRWPGRLAGGTRIRGTARLVDVMPTLLEQLGAPPVTGIQGTSLVPYIVGSATAKPLTAFSEAVKMGPEQKSLIRGDWKLIARERVPKWRLFNLATDPLEQDPRFGQGTETAKELVAELERQVAENQRLAASVEVNVVPISSEQRQRLENLGYVDGAVPEEEDGRDSEQGPSKP